MSINSLHLYAPFQAGDTLREIQELRARVYAEDGAIRPCKRHAVSGDDKAWHIVVKKDDQLAGCISANQVESSETDARPSLKIHSWALDGSQRKTRAGINLALSCFALAEIMGLSNGEAYATERNGSAAILEKLGGMTGHWRFDERFSCNMRPIWFSVNLLTAKHRAAVLKIKQRLTASQIERACM